MTQFVLQPMQVEVASGIASDLLEQKVYIPIKLQTSEDDESNQSTGVIVEYDEKLPSTIQPQLDVIKRMLQGSYQSTLEKLVELRVRNTKAGGVNVSWPTAPTVHHISRLIEHRDIAMSGHTVGNLLDDISVQCGRALAAGARYHVHLLSFINTQ